MKLEKIDHVVITVKNLNKTIDFYTNILGMRLEKFSSSLDNDQIRYAVSFGSQKINIHEEKKPIKPNALNPSSGSIGILPLHLSHGIFGYLITHSQCHILISVRI